jgi:hypothetical protein
MSVEGEKGNLERESEGGERTWGETVGGIQLRERERERERERD